MSNFDNLRNTISKAVDTSIRSVRGAVSPLTLDIYETETAIIVHTAPIDGLVATSIEVMMNGDELTIGGRTEATEAVAEDAYIRRERTFGDFSRTVNLPVAVEAEAASARVKKSGMLIVTLPKVDEADPEIINVQPAD